MGSLLWVTSRNSILTCDTHLHEHGFGPCSCPFRNNNYKGLYCQYTVQSLHEAPEALVLHVPAQIDLLLGLQ